MSSPGGRVVLDNGLSAWAAGAVAAALDGSAAWGDAGVVFLAQPIRHD
jgi:hypothetical protein